MSLSNLHKIPEIQKLLIQLEKEAKRESTCFRVKYDFYASGMRYVIWKIREIIDSA